MASDHVRFLGATISYDVSLGRHVVNVSCSDASGAHWDMDSATTLVHAFVSSHVDYCSTLLESAPKVVNDRLQWVLNAAARVVSSSHKYDIAAPALRASLARCA